MLKERLIQEARKASDDFSTKHRNAMRTDARNLNQALIQRTQQEVFSIARKTLTDLADASLEEQVSEAFIRQLRNMDSPAKAELLETATSAADPAVIRSAFSLAKEQCTAIQQAINETFAADVHTRFETAPELISGIELRAGGKKLAWSIADYLTSLEAGISELLHADEQPDTDSEIQREPTQSSASQA
jgi:F-type H+-transporting ATPase subunit b